MQEFLNLFLNNYTFKVVMIGCSILGIISAVVGTFAVLKKESLLGDGVSHASLAGVCAAFILTGKKEIPILLLGAMIVGVICIYIIHYIQKYSKVKFDGAIALILSTFFGLGLVLLTYLKKVPGAKKAGLNNFIFGQASTLIASDVYLLVGVGLVLLIIVLLFWKEMKISVFDKDYAKTIGINSDRIRLLISMLIVVNVIIGIQIAGVILITAMIISPAVAARQWSDRLSVVVFLASIFGGISGALGTAISALHTALPTGPLIIIVLSLFVIMSILFSPTRGIIAIIYRISLRNKRIRAQYGGDE